MDIRKPKHILSNVDWEHQTATCAVCGDTKIYVNYDPRVNKYARSCCNRVRATNELVWRRTQERKRLQNPNWKPRHKVSDIDLEKMIGTCAVCGLTKVYKRTVENKKYTAYFCATKELANRRKRGKRHVVRTFKSSLFVTLTQQDRQKIIDDYKLEKGCKCCGYNADPSELELHFSDLDKREFAVSNLVNFKRKRLLHILKICAVYCMKCHPNVHSESVIIK